MEEPVSKRKKRAPMPNGAEMMTGIRRRLDSFWNQPEQVQRAMVAGVAKPVLLASTVEAVMKDHLQGLPSGLETRPGSTLRPIGSWTTRDGELVEIQGQGNPLPEDDHLLVVTFNTTLTTTDRVTVDTHVAIFEISNSP